MRDSAAASEIVAMNYGRAIHAALRRALEEFPQAIFYGEDVGRPGGVFGITRGLKDHFGERVFDTPISETAMLGVAVGAAMTGMRPIVEIMWIDFSLVAMDQIVNQAANVRYVSAGRLSAPLTIRTQQGALPGSCAQHSQNLEALYAHIPGLVIGLPATAQDAYSILLSAISCDDPTLVIENRGLYQGAETDVSIGGAIETPGRARIERAGEDVTVLSWGAMVLRGIDAAEALAQQSVSAEVINARWLSPFDWETLNASVAKTRRLLIVHEANLTGGFGAEVAARISEKFFGTLAAPVRRLGMPDSRVPAAPHLQDALIPSTQAIIDAAHDLVSTAAAR
jgi:pyruvate/2-oxoglutarate/acetoin dehydrogenase E1 component